MSDMYEADESPRERATYSAFGDEYRGFDARDDEGKGKGMLIIALAAGVVLVFGTVIWNAYKQGIRGSDDGAPVFAADDTPYKRRPDEAGGSTTPNTEMRLFDSIDNNDRVEVQTVSETVNSTPTSQTAPDGNPRDLRPVGSGSTPNSTPSEPDIAVEDLPPVVEEPVARPTLPVADPGATAPPRPLPPVTASTSLNPLFDANGNYLVQLMALRDLAAVETAWSQMAEAHSDLFNGASMDVQRADLGARGIFYRLRVAAFADRADADKFCNDLKARGQTCIVTTRS